MTSPTKPRERAKSINIRSTRSSGSETRHLRHPHVLAFYAGAVVVPILLAGAIGLTEEQLIHLIGADLFTCGIASIIQSVGFWKVGVKLPLLQGVTFTAVSPMIAIALANGGGTEGLLYIYGSVIIAGLFTFFVAPYFAKLIRFFPPVVTGTVITIIGIALLPVAATDAVGGAANPDPSSGKNLAYAMGTLAIIVIIQRVFKGFMATVAVLAGLVIGTGVAFVLGDATFDSVSTSSWFEVTTPFFFGIPKFSIAAIISMIVVMLITAVETTGDVFATGEIVEKRVGAEDVSRALRADGLSTFIGGVLNSFPYTCFAENVGLVRLTRVKSRYVVAAAGVFMILLGLIPKAGALVASVPPPVLGGAALAMFATVAVVGIQTLARVDFHDHRNVVIVGTSLGLAVFVTVEPGVAQAVPDWAQIIFGSGITLGSLCAILLNLIFHHVGKDFGPAVAGTPGTGVIRLDQVNEMTREAFVQTFGRLFQGPTWVAERAYDLRPFEDTHDLRMAFQESLFSAERTEQRDLLSFYPDLGSDAVDGDTRGEESARDQGSVGLTLLNDEDHEEFAHLTEAYRDRFGIPLIVSVRDVENRNEILKSGWERMQNAPTQEFAAAVIEVAKIANHRFDDLVADASPILGARAARMTAAPPLSPAHAPRPKERADRRPATVQRDDRRRGDGDAGILPRRAALGAGRRRRPPLRDGARGPAPGQGIGRIVHRRGDHRGAGPSSPDRRAGRRRPRRRLLAAGTGRGRGRRPRGHRGDPGRQRRVREPIRPGLRDPGGRPAGHRDPRRTPPPAEQHPRGGKSRGRHPTAGDRPHPAGNDTGLMTRAGAR